MCSGGISTEKVQVTALERRIITLVCDGKTSGEIGKVLGLSPRTVETYRLRLMAKLDIPHLAALVKYAITHGLTTLAYERNEDRAEG